MENEQSATMEIQIDANAKEHIETPLKRAASPVLDTHDQTTARDEIDESDVDEEDLDLIAENMGVKRPGNTFKRLKRRADTKDDQLDDDAALPSSAPKNKYTRSLEDLFSDDNDDDDLDAEDGQINTTNDTVQADRDSEFEDDLQDFIVDDEGHTNDHQTDNERRDEQRRRMKHKSSADHAQSAYRVAQDLGISTDAYNDVLDLFGDGQDYAYALDQPDIMQSDERDYSKQPKTLEEIYEPAEVAEKMFTSNDDQIRITDLPERTQLRGTYTTPDEAELELEAKWMAPLLNKRSNTYSHNEDLDEPDPLVMCLIVILRMMRVEHLEIPFIIHHKPDEYREILTEKDLWRMAELDERWNHIVVKKRAIRHWSAVVPDFALIHAQVLDEDGVQDLSDYLQLRYRREMEEYKSQTGSQESLTSNVSESQMSTKKLKRPVRKDIYTLAKDAGIHEIAKHFGITPDQFGENFSLMMPRNIAEDHELLPIDLAAQFVSPEFNSVTAVIHAARVVLSQEIVTNLLVRSGMRQLMLSVATVRVTPTQRGKAEIDEMHEYYPFKYLKDKPVSRFRDHQFLLLEKAEKEGLLNVEIRVRADEMKRRYEGLYCNDNFSAVAEQWNIERRQILEMAFEDSLIPNIKRWLYERLVNEAIDYVVESCQKSLRDKVRMAPFRKRDMDEDEPHDVRVFAISCGGGEYNSATFGVLLNGSGTVVDYIKLNSIHAKDQEARNSDCLKAAAFLGKYEKVDVVAIAGWSIATQHLYSDMRTVIESAYKDNGAQDVTIAYIPDDCARIFRNSKRAQEEFPSYPALLRYCISLGRTVQEPLFEFCSLFNADNEVLFMKMDPLQDRVPPEKLYRGLERVMLEVVNDVGLDINRAITHKLAASPLQFVCGLGLRKAGVLLTKIKARTGFLESRQDLVAEVQLGACVFKNCASFIRVRRAYMGKRRSPTDVLDDTRIHPSNYSKARKIASDALDVENVVDGDPFPSKNVADVMNDTQLLDDLMLDLWAKIILENSGEKTFMLLETIKKELIHPYGEVRLKFTPASESDVFTMLTGESDRTLRPGMSVGAVVTRVKDRLASVQLDSGLDGLIHLKNLTDDQRVELASDVVSQGQALRCQVLEVRKDRFQVELSALPGSNNVRDGGQKLDAFFDIDAEKEDRGGLGDKSLKRQIKMRPIQHPQFKNIDSSKAEKLLSTQNVGDLVFRPSSSGTNLLALSWKVAENVYQHVQINEFEKDNELALGKRLKIKEWVFSGLDEIAALFVAPMVRLSSEIQQQSKFVKGNKEELFKHIDREVRANPKRIPYIFGFSDEPGKFWLVYRLGPHSEPCHESISISPGGYTFRRSKYKDLVLLSNAFKATQFTPLQNQSGMGQMYPPQSQAYPQSRLHAPYVPPMPVGYGMRPPPPIPAYGMPPMAYVGGPVPIVPYGMPPVNAYPQQQPPRQQQQQYSSRYNNDRR